MSLASSLRAHEPLPSLDHHISNNPQSYLLEQPLQLLGKESKRLKDLDQAQIRAVERNTKDFSQIHQLLTHLQSNYHVFQGNSLKFYNASCLLLIVKKVEKC